MTEELHTRAHPPDVPPTVIHHPEDDETVLARWLRLAIEKGPLFWLPVGGLLIVAVGLAVFAGSYSAGESAEAKVWTDVILSKGADDQEKIAEEHADSPAAGWALLHAAQAKYSEGFRDLPNNREAALPLLRQAIDLFKKAERDSPKDSPLKRIAATGIARSLETRNDLGEAAEEYQRIAKLYAGTEEARLAAERAKALREPAAVAFYKDFYEFKPSSVTLPPSGTSSFNLPSDHPPLNGPTIPASGLPPVFTPEMLGLPTSTPTPTPSKPGGGEFPSSLFENNPPPIPSPAAPAAKPEPPKAEPTPEPKPEPPKSEPKPEMPKPEPKPEVKPEPAKPAEPTPEPKKSELPSSPFPTPSNPG